MTERAITALPDELRIFLTDQARRCARAGMSPEEILELLRPIADGYVEKIFLPYLTATRNAFTKLDTSMIELGVSDESKKYYRSLLRQQMDLEPAVVRLIDEEMLWPNQSRLKVVE